MCTNTILNNPNSHPLTNHLDHFEQPRSTTTASTIYHHHHEPVLLIIITVTVSNHHLYRRWMGRWGWGWGIEKLHPLTPYACIYLCVYICIDIGTRPCFHPFHIYIHICYFRHLPLYLGLCVRGYVPKKSHIRGAQRWGQIHVTNVVVFHRNGGLP